MGWTCGSFEEMVRPCLRGRAFMVRYADDFVMAFEREDDARRVQDVLPKRLERFALELNPEKTRLVYFGRPRVGHRRPDTFDFLGFTLHWGKSRKGRDCIRWKTAKDRLARAIGSFEAWCRRYRHRPVSEQHAALSRKLRGHYAYFGLTMNMRSMAKLYQRVRRIWRKWLNRRSQLGGMPWERFAELLCRHPLPRPRVVHSVFRTA